MKIELLNNETAIDTWTIFYFTQDGKKYNGKLTVTNFRLLYDAKFDMTNRPIFGEKASAKFTNDNYLEIDKKDITNVEVKKSLFSKKCIVTLEDATTHTFDYGALSIDKCVAAIQS